MSDLAQAFAAAFALLRDLDPDLIGIVLLSLRVSLSATVIAIVLAAPLGALLAVSRFAGRHVLIVLVNALLGLPPVVVGLAGYLLLSRSGPLGFAGLLFTPAAMIIAQVMLTIPIVIALVHRATAGLWAEYGDLFRIDGASKPRIAGELLLIGRGALTDRVPCRVWPRHRRSGRHHHRRRQHPRAHPHHDHRHRSRDQQG